MNEMQNKLVIPVRARVPESEAKTKVEEAFQAYEQSVQNGEEAEIQDMKLAIFYIRSMVAQLHDYVDTTKEMLRSIGDISREVDGLFEIDVDPESERFAYNIGKYPAFMRNWVMRRRANKYYKEQMRKTMSKIETTMIRVGFASKMAASTVGTMGKMMKSFSGAFKFSSGKKKKKGGVTIPDKIAQDLERRKAASPIFGGTAVVEEAPQPEVKVGDTTGGAAPTSGAGDIPGDHWDED
ncbi:MAG: hypothetical protein IJT69_01400 [Clostridia bacterium]|nr:hypothetical protein [Clostridia bacterium]